MVKLDDTRISVKIAGSDGVEVGPGGGQTEACDRMVKKAANRS
jgi:hypothetical protein